MKFHTFFNVVAIIYYLLQVYWNTRTAESLGWWMRERQRLWPLLRRQCCTYSKWMSTLEVCKCHNFEFLLFGKDTCPAGHKFWVFEEPEQNQQNKEEHDGDFVEGDRSELLTLLPDGAFQLFLVTHVALFLISSWPVRKSTKVKKMDVMGFSTWLKYSKVLEITWKNFWNWVEAKAIRTGMWTTQSECQQPSIRQSSCPSLSHTAFINNNICTKFIHIWP